MGLPLEDLIQEGGRQSLVTPIDWKPQGTKVGRGHGVLSRQSLVTPIDWKLPCGSSMYDVFGDAVANPW